MRPVRDPESPKYRDDPDRVWYDGQWYTREQVERRREYTRRWREANPERKREADRRWYEANSEQRLEYVAKYNASWKRARARLRYEMKQRKATAQARLEKAYNL